MTTSNKTMSANTVIRDILRSIAEKEVSRRKPGAMTHDAPRWKMGAERGWLEVVAEEVAGLPWYEWNLPDGRTPPQPKAAVELVSLLAAVLENDTISPSSVNTTWGGGVAVEWHIGGIDLEIACQPDGTAEYSYEDRLGEEHEGSAWDDMTQLRQLIGRLPASRQQTE